MFQNFPKVLFVIDRTGDRTIQNFIEGGAGYAGSFAQAGFGIFQFLHKGFKPGANIASHVEEVTVLVHQIAPPVQ